MFSTCINLARLQCHASSLQANLGAQEPRPRAKFSSSSIVNQNHRMAMASSSASPAAIFAFLAPPLSLLRHVASLCAGYLGIAGGLKPSVRAPASSSSWSSSAAAAASQRDDEVEAAASVSTRAHASSCLIPSQLSYTCGFCLRPKMDRCMIDSDYQLLTPCNGGGAGRLHGGGG